MVAAVTTMHRRLIALAAAYAIALQAVLASFAALAAAGAAPGLCTSSVPQERPGGHTGHTGLCIACPACCGDGRPSGVPPTTVEVPAPFAAADRGILRPTEFDVRVTPRNRPPSRAPPAA
jgi:hypothetical protein